MRNSTVGRGSVRRAISLPLAVCDKSASHPGVTRGSPASQAKRLATGNSAPVALFSMASSVSNCRVSPSARSVAVCGDQVSVASVLPNGEKMASTPDDALPVSSKAAKNDCAGVCVGPLSAPTWSARRPLQNEFSAPFFVKVPVGWAHPAIKNIANRVLMQACRRLTLPGLTASHAAA